MRVSEYSYNVDASGLVRTLVGHDVWRPTGVVLLDGVQRTAPWFGPFGSPERDLLRVTAALLNADRLSPRRPANARGVERDLSWQRMISVRIAVENPSRWRSAAPVLQKLLAFMTDDIWEISFEGALPMAEQQVELDADARFASCPPTEQTLSVDEAKHRVFAMYVAYRREISNFLACAQPMLRPRPRHHRKEKERDLFSAAR